MHRTERVIGATLSATPYKAPKDAQRAYAKGVDAKRNGQLAIAQQSFERAVELYPKYTSAWFQLGTVLEKQKQQEAALRAYTIAATADKTFLPAYLSLTLMAYAEQDWTEVLRLTNHIIALDPMNHAALTDYILDLDPSEGTAAYFYNAVANFKLDRMEEAEKSAVKAEHLDMRTQFPEVHLLLADLFARKKDYSGAVAETQTYLDLVPHAKDGERVREQLARFQRLNASLPPAQPSAPR
jgi:tetratricopeptide (TPR) repeat protein